MEHMTYPEHLVFGLDIGTRSIVGTVGYKENNGIFKVVAQFVKEHNTRAMIDGQIHDIAKVSETIAQIKKELENQIGIQLTEVCIAAAGRVLKTVTVKGEYEFPNETLVNDEHIHSLDLIGVEKGYEIVRDNLAGEDVNFYCVGYSVIRYYLNGYSITNLEGHKANKIGAKLLVTFLPDEVVDSLYAAVERAGLIVADLTLEPIAAINVAIPEKFRLLNIALVDVGAGTSDISITKDGSIIAYGMIPYAGDEITEIIASNHLVEFQTAEKIKQACLKKKTVSYKDILEIKHKVNTVDIIDEVSETVNMITKSIAEKICELNGGKAVNAVFIIGGGGKIPGFVSFLSEYLELPNERVALRGEEVLRDVEFLQAGIKKDSLLVTPIGICLNFYNQKNNFIMVNVNGERVRLYDNNNLTIIDVALAIGFPNEKLFPRRGKPLNFMVNGEKRLVRGELGEAAIIKCNNKVVGINTLIEPNDKIEIIESTIGTDAQCEIGKLSEYKGTITFEFNDKNITCPKFSTVNGELASELYNIVENDEIQILMYYTLQQALELMDLEYKDFILVNNVIAEKDTKIYDKFSIQYSIEDNYNENIEAYVDKRESNPLTTYKVDQNTNVEKVNKKNINSKEMVVFVNKKEVILSKKPNYILVDVLDFYYFDLKVSGGSELVTLINGIESDFVAPIHEGDDIKIYWKE